MKSGQSIIVFGASGKVGSLLVKYALADGYKVTAFVHRHHNLPEHPALTVFRGDIYNADDVRKALHGQDVVMSALGSWGTKNKDVLTAAMTNIIPAMQQMGITRIVSLTGAEARAEGDHLSILHRFAHLAIGIVAGKVLHDGEQHIQLLERSGLDWTVIRSPIMSSTSRKTYHLSRKRPAPWALIDRPAVARAMVDRLADDSYFGRAMYIRGSHK